MSLERGPVARGLSSVFYAFRNSINIYTEDDFKNKKFYKSLFKKLLEGTDIKVEDVHPLGNCETVIKRCKEDTDNSMPKLYIIDGDIYLMTTPRPAVEHLYILDAYCMENKVIDEESYYRVFEELDPYHTIEEIRDLANYDTMMSAAEEPFMKLYCHKAVCREKLNCFSLQSAKEFMSNGSISAVKVDKECKKICQQIVNNSGLNMVSVEAAVSDKMNQYPAARENLMKYVSGKDYLLVYIDDYTKNKLKSHSGQKKEFWKFQFMKYNSLEFLKGLKEAIVREVTEFRMAN